MGNVRRVLMLSFLLSCAESEPARNDSSVRDDATAWSDAEARDARVRDASEPDTSAPIDGATLDGGPSLEGADDAAVSATDGEIVSHDAASGCMPNAELLWGGGRTLSTCQEGCRFEVGLSPVVVPDLGCIGYWALLQVQDAAGVTLYTVDAELSSLAWSDASIAGSAIRAQAPAPSASCDACENPSWLSLVDDMLDADPVDYRFPRSMPPPELTQANAFLQKLIDQMLVCQGDYLVTCVRNDR